MEHLRPPVDVIVCSDCIYMATSVEPLVRTMLRLSDERTAIWVRKRLTRSLTNTTNILNSY